MIQFVLKRKKSLTEKKDSQKHTEHVCIWSVEISLLGLRFALFEIKLKNFLTSTGDYGNVCKCMRLYRCNAIVG